MKRRIVQALAGLLVLSFACRAAAEDAALAEKCIAPAELGAIVRGILEQPDHLTVPEVTVQPMVQDICPM